MNRRCIDLLKKARNNPAGVRFSELQSLCKCVGMRHDRTRGSHFIYKRNNPSFILSIQKMPDGKAKPYQVKQLLDFIEEYNLGKEE
ncbi:MAG TPA: type II toxin-antitoxin system HicA family toxin [Nitrospirae bacterium]|nr:type II toxin-antitoxin system HicA family toxin [Nitrospirota bacterium]HDZ88985.1 type II toxin-antitoxin system HicA family toxin [Nitrospirota bacterium]